MTVANLSSQPAPAGETNGLETTKPRTPLSDALREFRRNKVALAGVVFIFITLFVATFAPLLAPYHFADQNLNYPRQPPMTGYILTTDQLPRCHWAGTPIEWGCTLFIAGSDSLGRDLWSRVIYGTRVSLAVAIVASTVSLLIGTLYGLLSGYLGGAADNLLMRFVDFLYAVPAMPIIIMMTVYFQGVSRQGVTTGLVGVLIQLNNLTGGLLFLFIAIGALNWIGMARLARGQVLAYKQKEFVEAARAVGSNDLRIMLRHMLPNIIGPLLISESMAIPGYIFLESTLSFIGLGVNPPTPSWGAMINDGYLGLRSNPHLVFYPGAALAMVTLAFNFVGDGLRDAFDTRLRGRK